jgi:hypothetical protein
VHNEEPPTRRWPHRLIAAIPGCIFSAVLVAIQIPAVRETIGAAKDAYRFINSTVPSLGTAAIWIGFVMLVAGIAGAWRSHRVLKEGTTKMVAVGSAVLVIAVGGLVAAVSTFDQHGSPLVSQHYEARVIKHHRRRHHHPPAAHTPSSSGTSPTGSAHSSPGTAPSTTPAPSSTPTPSSTPSPSATPAPTGSSGSASEDSGGNNNTITVEKNNHQTGTSGNATGENATSGEVTNENNEGPVNITIG